MAGMSTSDPATAGPHAPEPLLPAARALLIGASAAGLAALVEVCAALPENFPAPVLVVLHIGAHRSQLPAMLNRRCALKARFATDGECVQPGRIYVAAPDHHLLLMADTMSVLRGPKENWTRPAIDPLFRSAAQHWGARAIGVLLAGRMVDGCAGLRAIKAHGGVAIVQDPRTAKEASMPRSALDHVAVDLCLPPADIPAHLLRLARGPVAPPAATTRPYGELRAGAHFGADEVERPDRSSTMACPACGDAMQECADGPAWQYSCQRGHVFSGPSLAGAQAAESDEALRDEVRALQRREVLLRRLAAVARASGREREAQAGEKRADELLARLAHHMRLLEAEGPLREG